MATWTDSPPASRAPVPSGGRHCRPGLPARAGRAAARIATAALRPAHALYVKLEIIAWPR
jgi:hypothetical protein